VNAIIDNVISYDGSTQGIRINILVC
jgi:hypothetical protein